MFDRKEISKNITSLYKRVGNFLSRAQSREVLTFLFFLSLSFFFWMLQSMNEETEGNFIVPIKYKNVPTEYIFTNLPPDQLNLRIRDKGVVLLNYSFAKRFQPLEIDFAQFKNKDGITYILQDQILGLLRKQLLVRSSVVSMQPDSINLYYSELMGKKVPVLFDGDLGSGQQSQLGRNIQIVPDSVEVYAPEAILDTIYSVKTAFVTLRQLVDTADLVLNLVDRFGAKYSTNSVNVVIPVEEFTEKEFLIPIRVMGVPDSLTLRTFPSVAKISCFVTLSNFKDVYAGLFEVIVDYQESLNSATNRVPLEVIRAPDIVTNVRIEPEDVEFILEEKEHDD